MKITRAKVKAFRKAMFEAQRGESTQEQYKGVIRMIDRAVWEGHAQELDSVHHDEGGRRKCGKTTGLQVRGAGTPPKCW